MLLADTNYAVLASLVGLIVVIVGGLMVLIHVVGPKRHGAIKESTYESGLTPFGDTRRRFNVRFYVVAILFMVFDVEIIFFYPWATTFPRLTAPGDAAHTAWQADMIRSGFGPGYFLVAMLLFTSLLIVGFIYEWRKGVFKWD